MTEKTILQQINNLAFDIQHTDDLQVAFEKASEILKLTDHDTPPFAVGEYYSTREGMIFQVINEPDDGYIGVKFLVKDEMICNRISIFGAIFKNKKPATTEQIATFKLAQFYDENNISETQKDQYRKMLSNGKMPIGPWLVLQEVENNE